MAVRAPTTFNTARAAYVRTLIEPRARKSDPETSHEAAVGNEDVRTSQALRLLAAFEAFPEGLTAVEAGVVAGLPRPDRRVSDLLKLELVERVLDEEGKKVSRTPFNNWHPASRAGGVWRITAAGRGELAVARAIANGCSWAVAE